MATARAYEALADELRGRIRAGELAEGDRLPSETQLATEAGVSRSTVREALRTLQEGGFVERASPKVMVVRSRAGDPVFRELHHAMRRRGVTFAHLVEALLVIEPELTRLAAVRAEPGDLGELRDNLAAQEAHLEDFEEWNRLDQEFHLTIAELSANPALVVARAPISELLLPALDRFMRSSSLTAHATDYHRRILGELEIGDPDTAAAMVRRHVNDFRAAWVHAGLEVDLQVAELGSVRPPTG